jgi:hypothetical protein
MIRRCEREGKPEAKAVIAQFDTGQDVEIHGHCFLGPDIPDGEIHDTVAVLPAPARKDSLARCPFSYAFTASSLDRSSECASKPSPNDPKRAHRRVARKSECVDDFNRARLPRIEIHAAP